MRLRKKRPEEEMASSTSASTSKNTKEPVNAEWSYWPDEKGAAVDPPDYSADAIKAANEIDPALNTAWDLSKNNKADATAQEYAGGIVKKADGTYKSVNQKEGNEGDSKPKVRKKDMVEGETEAGEYHTHPYSPDEIALVTPGYNWDGTGTGPSGADFSSLAYQKLSDGHFSIVEAGTVRAIIVVTDAKAFKAAFLKSNGPITVDMGATIDEFIGKTVVDPVYGTPDVPGVKKNYADVYWIGLLRGLDEIKKENGGADIGMKLLKSKPDKKSEYDTVYPKV